ncbi:MAG: phosphoribosylglycinamide formyltransferase [candidate division KSB1 bacterium]|jgi:phosphoribosylglycinamide formyltransferase-1|nr:phosphoribosylglycinamide formyltransferase [candidate division KSB1 bacterium]
MKKKIAIFISGRGSNMKAIAENVKEGMLHDCCEIALVFSNKPDAKGLETAQQMGFNTASIESRGKKRAEFEREVIDILKPLNIDYVVLAGFMRILSPVFIREYKDRIINIHPADTALYQGAHAYEWAFENCMESTMITIHYVDEGVDTGEVIAQRSVDLKGANTLEEVERRGLKVEHQLYSKTLLNLFRSVKSQGE